MKTVQVIKWIFLGAGLCSLLGIPLLGLGSAAMSWHGICYGFTDSQLPCTWWEFAKNEMFWASFLLLPLSAMTLGGWLIVNIIQWAGKRK